MNTATGPEPSVTRDQSATLFVALELSKATWLVALHAPDRDRISQHRACRKVWKWP
jgi:transposase